MPPTILQFAEQAPAIHISLAAQTLPHWPQLFLSVFVLISQPFASFISQLANPALHVPRLHTLALHCAAPLAYAGHALPQPLQCATLVVMLVSQPLATAPSQLSKLALQLAIPQLLAAHPATPLATAGHAFPHVPQFPTFVAVSVSQPFTGPALHVR